MLRHIRVLILSVLAVAVVGILSGCPSGKNSKGSAKDGEKGGTAAAATPCGVLPSRATVDSGEYTPLSRPLFLHVNKKSLARPEVAAFVKYYLNEGQSLVEVNKFIPLPPKVLEESRQAFARAMAKNPEAKADAKLAGNIEIQGSSTVYPISQAVAVEFMKLHPEVKVSVGSEGTGNGFKKFVKGDTDINDSSRSISKQEIEQAEQSKVEWVELKVAVDALTVVVNPENDWCSCMTVEQLHKLWQPKSEVKYWSDLDKSWPEKEIKLYGPGTGSGTFDYFTEAVNGKSGKSRTDFQASENDNTLAIGVEKNKYALAYFGYSYYASNGGKLKALGIIPAAKKKE